MGIINLNDEEKALSYFDHNRIGVRTSLEEKDSLFFHEEIDESKNFLEDDDNCDNNFHDPVERALIWQSQDALLQEVMDRYGQTGSKLRQEVSRIVDLAKETNFCNCLKPDSYGCIGCLRQRVVDLLCQRGFKATLCTSKWRHTKKFPGGKHEYIELIANASGRKKQISYLIELEFRDQFNIAKACDEYLKLISQLPEYYIGKADYLNAIVRILCDAAKRSMKEKKIHMGPWRKRSFMQMKWSNSSNRRSLDKDTDNGVPIASISTSGQQVHEPILHFYSTPAIIVT